jgi:ribosomal protein S18 acetylase RimI-like enzyme
MTPASHLVRRMTEADLDRVMEIAGSLKEAPHWPRSAYLAALDAQGTPARIALVAETVENAGYGYAREPQEVGAPIPSVTLSDPEWNEGESKDLLLVPVAKGWDTRKSQQTPVPVGCMGSHPFRKEREKDGAPSMDREPNVVAGFAVASVLGPQAELEMIAVAADCQRGGMARGIFTTLIKNLRSMRAEELLLEVRISNHPALEFYRSQGFKETGRRPRYYSDPVEDAVLMLLPL